MSENGRLVGASAHVPFLRTCRLLRFLQEQACDQAFSSLQTPGHAVHRTRRELALVLCGRDHVGLRRSRFLLGSANRRKICPLAKAWWAPRKRGRRCHFQRGRTRTPRCTCGRRSWEKSAWRLLRVSITGGKFRST